MIKDVLQGSAVAVWDRQDYINEAEKKLENKDIWDKVFKSGLSKFCGRQSLKNFEGIWSALNFLKAVFHKIYLVHS